MARLDIGAAALSGFGVIKRNPLAPAVWGLLRVVLTMGPMLLFLPALIEFIEAMPTLMAQDEPDFRDIAGPYMAMNAASPLSFICGLVAYGLVTGAVFRAVLNPEDKAWFFLRFGLGEVMIVVVTIVIVVLMIVVMIPAGIILGIAGFAGSQAPEAVGGIAVLLLLLAMIGFGIWAALRLSLAPAMSFETRSFRLFESWRPTKGHALSLFLMALLNLVIVILIEIVVGAIVGGIAIGVIFSGIDLTALQDNPQAILNRENIERWLPWVLGIGAVTGILSGYLITIIDAPWAAAYKALVKDEAVEVA